MVTGRKLVLTSFTARRLDDKGLRDFAPGEVIVLQPYVWAGPNEESFTFDGVNYGVAGATLQDCTLLLPRGAGTVTTSIAGKQIL
jgi:hypothetical protein